jgi:light-regulated signal transduction histidine kinase (bacteriophytochrome)
MTRRSMSPEEIDTAKLRADLQAVETRLRRANIDFQEFVSRVSHDLRDPMRTIASYTQLLAAKNANTSDEESILFQGYILDAVEQAQALLAAMVEYASAEAERHNVVRVNMKAVTLQAMQRLNPPPDAVTIEDPLPVVSGDFDVLSKVMYHLLDNAIKFSGRPDPRVHVSAHPEGYDHVIVVRDNGPGIDPQHCSRIFDLFRRLHGREIPGRGLGLAYARKAVESTGGRIWVESKPGEGSTFQFVLPSPD